MATVILKLKPNFDLLPRNPYPLLLKVEESKVNLEVKVEMATPNFTTSKLWTSAGEKEMERYRGVIEATVKSVTSKWDKMVLKDREVSAADLTKACLNAIKSMQGAVEAAIKAYIAAQDRSDKNLREARVSVAMKGTFKIIAIGKDIAVLAVSGGAAVTHWVALAKDVKALAKIIYDASADEPKLRSQLLDAIGKYTTTKQRYFAEASKAKDWKQNAKFQMKKFWTSEKSLAEKAEAARKTYRNEVAAMVQRATSLGGKADGLLAALRKSGDHTKQASIAAGAKVMVLKREVGVMIVSIDSCQTFATDMQSLLSEGGVATSDATFFESIRSLKGAKAVLSTGASIYSAAKDIADIIDAIK